MSSSTRSEKMSVFQIQTIESAPEGSKAPLEKLQQAFGMVPNIAGVIANSPVLANIFVELFQGVHNGTLTEAEIQTLLLTNAVTNSCSWAVAFHSFLALQAGLDPADVHASRAARPSLPMLATLLKSAATSARPQCRPCCRLASRRTRRWRWWR